MSRQQQIGQGEETYTYYCRDICWAMISGVGKGASLSGWLPRGQGVTTRVMGCHIRVLHGESESVAQGRTVLRAV